MAQQGIDGEPRLGNLLPLKHPDRSGNRRGACRRTAAATAGKESKPYTDHLAAAAACLAGTSRAAADAALEFGRFRVLLRQRQLVAGGVPIELGTRALDLLLVLLEADGSLVTKDELLDRVWPGIVVAEENLKVQMCKLRKALGEDRDFIRTEFGRGYRFTPEVRSTVGRGRYGDTPQRRHWPSHAGIRQCISW
jgi:DNA-binding winged helix-turn-helix (wHTH) protein